ncbi:MAG: DUF1003 domain-containing protein [Sphingomonas sp.]|uniref:DUF1003 domain-containing protein n=1 Tax=Sphingomonas sp. TaxID=28214 RepID=UPI00356463D6
MTLETVRSEIREGEARLLAELRRLRRIDRADHGAAAPPPIPLTAGQRIADTVAATMGSWKFIIIQTTILFFWIALNITAWIEHWDPYPFILLNLALSFQAAYAAPFIMMSQNRQQDIDRLAAEHDYQVNIKAELEIESLHEKLDLLRENEVLALSRAVQQLTELLNRSGLCDPPADGAGAPAGPVG